MTLEGKVTMPYKRDDIEKRRGREWTACVRSSIKLDVLPVSRAMSSCVTGSRERSTAMPTSGTTPIMPNPPIHIVVEHGRVTLTGVVQSEVERMLARSLATQFGVFSVTNKLKTEAEIQDSA